jgi:hypothetical protein
LTQVDAGARCIAIASQLRWNTHSCPADVPCSGNVPSPSIQQAQTIFRNNSDTDAYVVIKEYRPDRSFRTRAWQKVAANSTRIFSTIRPACIGISQNQRDYIQDKLNQGSFFTGTLQNVWVHNSNRTDFDYGLSSNGDYWARLYIPGVRDPEKSWTGFTQDGIRELFNMHQMVNYRCHYEAQGGAWHVGVE